MLAPFKVLGIINPNVGIGNSFVPSVCQNTAASGVHKDRCVSPRPAPKVREHQFQRQAGCGWREYHPAEDISHKYIEVRCHDNWLQPDFGELGRVVEHLRFQPYNLFRGFFGG